MISFNVAEAARVGGREALLGTPPRRASTPRVQAARREPRRRVRLKEEDAWPAQPQDAYGLEKLMTEELLMHYDADFGMECRIGRFHNIYGPVRHVEGRPREGARGLLPQGDHLHQPSSRCGATASDALVLLHRRLRGGHPPADGLGLQEAAQHRLGRDGLDEPDGRAGRWASRGKPEMPIKHIPGPEGVRGRNSNKGLKAK